VIVENYASTLSFVYLRVLCGWCLAKPQPQRTRRYTKEISKLAVSRRVDAADTASTVLSLTDRIGSGVTFTRCSRYVL